MSGMTAEERAKRLTVPGDLVLRDMIAHAIRSAECDAELRVVARVREWIRGPDGTRQLAALLDSIEHAAAPGSTPERDYVTGPSMKTETLLVQPSGEPWTKEAFEAASFKAQPGAQPHPPGWIDEREVERIKGVAQPSPQSGAQPHPRVEFDPLTTATAEILRQHDDSVKASARAQEALLRQIAREEILPPIDALERRVHAHGVRLAVVEGSAEPDSFAALRDRVVEAAKEWRANLSGRQLFEQGIYLKDALDALSAAESKERAG